MDNEVMLYFITENVIVDNSISFELQSSDRTTTTEQKTFFLEKRISVELKSVKQTKHSECVWIIIENEITFRVFIA